MIVPGHGLAQEPPHFANLKLKVAEKAINHQEALQTTESLKTLDEMARAALDSRRLDLIGLCFEKYSTCWHLYTALRKSSDEAFKAEVVLLMLRSKSFFWPSEVWSPKRPLDEPIKGVLKIYLPKEKFDDSATATEVSRMAVAEKLAQALEKSTSAMPGKGPVLGFTALTLKQAEVALNRTMSYLDLQQMAKDAVLSRRLDLIELCFENHYTRGFLYYTLRDTIDIAFKAQVVLMMLRSQSGFWPSEVDTGDFVPRRYLEEPIRGVLKTYLPQERFNDSTVATEAASLAAAKKMALALEKDVRTQAGKSPVVGFAFLTLKQAEAAINHTDSKRDLEGMARVALDSRRIDLIKLCFEKQYTRLYLYEALRDTTNLPFKAQVVMLMLRTKSCFWQPEYYSTGFFPPRPLDDPIKEVLKSYLPGETFGDDATFTRVSRLALAEKLALAKLLVRFTGSQPKDGQVAGFADLTLEQAEAVIQNADSSKVLEEMARAALASRRIELIDICIKKPSTRFGIYKALNELKDLPFQAHMILRMLRSASAFYPQGFYYYSALGNRTFRDGIQRILTTYLPGETIDVEAILKIESRLALAEKLAAALEKSTIAKPGDGQAVRP